LFLRIVVVSSLVKSSYYISTSCTPANSFMVAPINAKMEPSMNLFL